MLTALFERLHTRDAEAAAREDALIELLREHGASLPAVLGAAPPARAEYSTVPAARFFREELPRAAEPPLLCVQRGGDVIFVPNGWGHSVLNLKTSVGYAVEFSSLLHAFY